MASPQPIFDTIISGSGLVGTESWVDLGLVPLGRQILLGYATYIAEDKNCQFETRSNLYGYSDGSLIHTQLHDWVSVPTGSSMDRDFYFDGNVNTLTVVSTGAEHLWVRVVSRSAASGAYDYIIRYLLQ